MRKINVLHIITKLELGGAQENTLYSVANHDREKYNVFLISGTEGELVEDAKGIKDAQIILLPELKHKISPFYDIYCLLKLWRLFKKYKIDIIHTHSSKAGILGRFAGYLAKIPIIIQTIHGFSFNDYQNFFVRNLYIFFERIAAKISDKLIAVTKIDIEKGLKAKVGVAEQYTVIHSGINIDEFSSQHKEVEVRKEFNIPLDYKIVGMIACFKPQKNPLDFIRVAKIVKESFSKVKFILVGDGELRPDIEKLISELNLHNDVILTGWRRDVAEILSSFNVLVLTSLWEGLPRVFPEAMAERKPIVATSVDGAKEVIINGENGFLLEPKNLKGMAEKITYLLNNENIAKKMGECGFNIAKSFDAKEMVKDIEEVYELKIADGELRIKG
ncbi:MAG: glycosyltransferase family 4 protein [Candidatus Firestonebacteria bacterium]